MRKLYYCLILAPSLAWAAGASAPQASAAPSVPSLAASAVAASAAAPSANPYATPSVNATAYWVADSQSRQVLAEQKSDEQIEPASLTKLMSLYVLFQALPQLPDALSVSEDALAGAGPRMYLQAGQKVKTADLIKGVAVLSADDATLTLAKAVAGSEAAFVKKMNDAAHNLGLTHTHFANATGQSDPDHYSSAHDLGVLTQALRQDFPQYMPFFTQTALTFNGLTQQNRNWLLFRDTGVNGMAMGYAPSGGYATVITSDAANRHVVVVLIGSETTDNRAIDAGKLLNWATTSFQTIKLFEAHAPLQSLSVALGQKSSVLVGAANDVFVTLPIQTGADGFQAALSAQEPLNAPIDSGDKVGDIRISQHGKPVMTVPALALEPIHQAGYFGRWWDRWRLWLGARRRA